MSSIRFTDAQLAEYTKRTGKGVASSTGTGQRIARAPQPGKTTASTAPRAPALGDWDQIAEPAKSKAKKSTPAKDAAKKAAQSIREAIVTGKCLLGESMELTFDGARMLSTNQVLALSHFQRVAYRKAWHDAIEAAVLLVTSQSLPRRTRWTPLSRFTASFERHAPRQCDMDALISYFKYPLDGLRYAGVIVDDNPKHLLNASAIQVSASYKVVIRLQVASTTLALESKAGTQQP